MSLRSRAWSALVAPAHALPLHLSVCAALAFACTATDARADEVILKDGSVMRGEVVDPPAADPAPPKSGEAPDAEEGPEAPNKADPSAPVRVRVRRGKSTLVVEVPRDQVRWVRRLDDTQERMLAEVEDLLLDGKHARAIERLETFVKANPKDARGQRELGFARLLANQPEAAVVALSAACALDPLDLEAHLSLARAQEGVGQRDAAITAYRRACLLGPTHARTFQRLSGLLRDRAAARLERLAGLPEGERAASDVLAARRDHGEAVRTLRRARKVDPLDEGIALDLAATLLESEDPKERDQAAVELRAFLAKTPQAAGAVRVLAQLEAADGHPKKALLRLVGLLKRRDLPAPLRERLEAEASLYAWLQAGAKTPAPAGLDAGQPKVDLRRARLRLVFLIELLPEDGRLMLALARVELRSGELGEGRVWLDRAALAGPESVQRDAGLLQEICVRLVRSKVLPNATAPQTFFGKSVALDKARNLVSLAPWLPAAHRTLGEALERTSAYKEAAQAYANGIAWSAGHEREDLIKAAQRALETAKRAERNKDL